VAPTVVPSPTEVVDEAVDKPQQKDEEPSVWWDFGPSYSGSYSTDELVELEALLASLGAPEEKLRALYAPFIVRGPAEFSDTWGSIRHADEDELRPHLGQDVFCEMGAEVLAVEDGTVEYSTDELGGKVAHLNRADGGYWYYAHLSDYARGIDSGDRVEEGDVIAYCGDSGNALGGSPHVHFGSYPGPVNPAGDLIEWLSTAERRADEMRARTIELRGEAAETARLFGDEMVPESDPLYPERPPLPTSFIDDLATGALLGQAAPN
jgi:murein DD-endopeptidase MepM/ murein hydrolase activator NlpD